MSSDPDHGPEPGQQPGQQPGHQPEQQQAGGDTEAGRGHASAAEQPPFGWYYFGPEPPSFQPQGPAAPTLENGYGAQQAQHGPAGWGGDSPSWHGGHGHRGPSYDDSADLKEAFNRLSRGDLSADTIGKLIGMSDREFWKGALAGAAAVLLVNNLPAVRKIFAGAANSGAGGGAQGQSAQQSANRNAGAGGSKKEDQS